MSAAMRHLSNARIQNRIDELPILEDTPPKHALTNEPALLEHSHRRRIPLEYRRLQTHQVEMSEHMIRRRAHRGRHDAATPVRLTQPVAEVARLGVNPFTKLDTDAADELLLNLDGPVCRPSHRPEKRKPGIGI